jgi:hypothetical protein
LIDIFAGFLTPGKILGKHIPVTVYLLHADKEYGVSPEILINTAMCKLQSWSLVDRFSYRTMSGLSPLTAAQTCTKFR